MDESKKYKVSITFPFRKIWDRLTAKKAIEQKVNVYFISGMCYNCKVFDQLKLPKGFEKKYIEWHTPLLDESLSAYTHEMAKQIDTTQAYILVGYSFGAVIIQEMNSFLKPIKSIIISSFKNETEIPTLFKVVKRGNLTERIPMRLYNSTRFVTNAFNKLVYHIPTNELSDYMTVTDAVYIKWAVNQITNWIPECKCENLYHIHGTDDQVFPYELIKNAFPIEGGDHLMLIKKASEINIILDKILLIKEA